MLIAIDHGNYAIKTPHHSFVSGLSEHTVKPPMADEILEYDGRYWTPSGKRLSYMRDKTQDERYFILTLFAIAKELEDTGRYSPVEQIQLAVGLPPEHYGVLKDKFARYFKRDGIIKFVYEDIPEAELLDLAQCESWPKITRMQSPYDFEEERLTKAFMELPLKRRQVMELLFLEDLSEAETAQRLNCSLQYVRNQRCIALKRLRSHLMEGGDDE